MEGTREILDYLLIQASQAIWERTEEIMLTLYWEIGFHLREYDEKELKKISRDLAMALGVEKRMLEIAYHYYMDNPVKKKAIGVGK